MLMHKLSLKCLSQFFGFGKIQVLIGWIGLLNSGNLTVEAKIGRYVLMDAKCFVWV